MSHMEWTGFGVVVLLFLAAIWSVRRDYRATRTLSTFSVVVVWAAYVVHGVYTMWIAWRAPLGRLPLPAVAAHVGGGALMGIGVWLCFESVATFRSFARMSGMDNSTLVTNGIYAFSRNPQNLGWGLTLLGIALAGRSPAALVLAAIFALIIHSYIVWLEEPYLERIYGDAWRRYKHDSARYLGVPADATNEQTTGAI